MNDRVLVVLTNYRRPANIPLCIQAWRNQSLPPASIILVDNSSLKVEERYPNFQGVDDVFRSHCNLGPLCRLWPALAISPKYKYILFCDDDYLPGKEGLQATVEAAKQLNDKFATVGQEGRIFTQSSEGTFSYKFGNAPRSDKPSIVDCTVRTHLVLAAYLPRAISLREKLPAQLCHDHDDLTLCLGLQLNPGWPSYVVPASTLERQLIKENLDGVNGPEACWKRPEHLAQRSQFVNLAYGAGWRSFVEGV